jgi:N-glycosylase/DNA lyase
MKFRLGFSHPFDLNLTLCCGQAFRWDSQDDWWCGVTHGKVVRIKQEGDALEFENVDRDFLMNYFGLDDDLLQVLSQINKDKYVEKAVETCRGLRILRQEPWECLISYICATYKNIASIKRMLLALSTKFGEPTFFKERTYHAFPAPEALAEASLKDLAKCELGYRAKYVLQTAKAVCANDFDFAGLRRLPYEEAKAVLLEFPGVGQKVADCVLLFSLGKYEAFPVDVWIRRVLLRHYAQHFPEEFVQKISQEESLDESQYKRLNLFGRKYFGKYAGYAQEYLYHYERACCGSKPARKPFNREAGSIRFGSCGKRLN